MQYTCAILPSRHPGTAVFFLHYVIYRTIWDKKLLNMKCAFWFSLQFLCDTFPVLRRLERDVIKIYFGLHVKFSLFSSEFHETWILWTDFSKILKYQISWKSVQWKPSFSMRTDRRMDSHVDKQEESKKRSRKFSMENWIADGEGKNVCRTAQ